MKSYKLVIGFLLLFLLQSSCTSEKNHRNPPSFVSNKKPDTYFFEQVIHKENSTEVLFYLKFNYKQNELSIYRPEHSNVGIEVEKLFSHDSMTFYIALSYFKKSDGNLPIIRRKFGRSGIQESFSYSDQPGWLAKDYASGSRMILLVKSDSKYELVHMSMEKEEDVNDLRYFIFDDNPEEKYFFRFNDGEKTTSYPRKKEE